MTSASLVDLLDFIENAGIECWLDGGWGVDALLKRQTRPHKDVDLVVRVSDVSRLVELLKPRRFKLVSGSLPNSFVLADGRGLEIDIHAVEFDSRGNGVYRMESGKDWTYPAEGFFGSGSIEDREVNCLTPQVQVLCHAEGYRPTDRDLQDMRFLDEMFALNLPPQLRRKDH